MNENVLVVIAAAHTLPSETILAFRFFFIVDAMNAINGGRKESRCTLHNRASMHVARRGAACICPRG